LFTISKEFHFSASHILETLPAEHPCSRLHGHNYVVEIRLQSDEINDHGFVVDYRDLAPFKAIIDSELDHRHLNDIIPGPSTAENIAHYLYQRALAIWPQITSIRVQETPKTWAEYHP
jgi:6-pyruvoyltetrahydropterin/6-carboxytetrahydropterin synthase